MRRAALAVAISHAAIAVAGLLVIAPGTAPTGTVASRASYVAAHSGSWLAAWLVPPVAALALLWLVTELRRRNPHDVRLELAVYATAVGAAIEGGACAIASALPAVATADPLIYGWGERIVQLGTSTFGNLPFTASQFLITSALAREGAPRPIVALGVATGASGLAFGVAGAVASAALPAANGALLGSLIAFAVALALRRVT